ncbi:MAG: NADase-type glycan-binding domain-containing protein [Bilifractor sp.]|jgi:hypothetical protein
MRCPNCGNEVGKKDKRCPYCGKNLRVVREERRLKRRGAIMVVLILAVGSIAFSIAASGLEGSPFSSGNQMLSSAVKSESVASSSGQAGETASTSGSGVSSDSAASSSAGVEGSIGGEDHSEDSTAGDEPLTAELTEDQEIMDLSGYSKAAVSGAEATSVMPANDGSDAYAASSAVDGIDSTSWQEGEEGNGIGSMITLNFDREYSVRYVLLKLGNWRSDKAYQQNNRPQSLTLILGNESVQVTFPDEKKEYCVTLSKDVKVSSLTLQIDSVYEGSSYDDTCISEIEAEGY